MSKANQSLLRAPFSLQKITWNPDTKTVIYSSRRSWHTKRNVEVFNATDFLAAAIEHIPPKGQQTIRYYGLYSNKSRGRTKPTAELIPPPPNSRQSRKKPTSSFIIHPSNFLRSVPCAHSGGISSSAFGEPIRSNAPAVRAPCAASNPSSAPRKSKNAEGL